MRAKPYKAYKPSGVAWLGAVPTSWGVKRLKYSASINDDALPETTDPEFEMEYVDISSVDAVAGITTRESLVFENAPSRARRTVRDGDTIVSTVRTYLRAIAPVRNPPKNLVVSTGFAVVRPRKVVPEFLSYALREVSFVESVVARSVGVSYPAINASEVGDIPIPLPSEPEQRAIAAFLDRETGRIDTLVAKKRELIERLQEKRIALISHAVTKGLNPKAKLKPSGLPWLGDIPVYWETKRLRRLLCKIEQGVSPQCDNAPAAEHEWGVLKAGCCNRGIFRAQENKAIPDEFDVPDELEVAAGDMLMSRASGSEELIGSVAIVPPQTRAKLILSDKIYRLVPMEGQVVARYLAYALQSSGSRSQIQSVISGALGLAKNIAQSDVLHLAIATPPFVEQQFISDYLDRTTTQLDALMRKAEEAIERLQEYRTALITAAVTGKIDVRAEHGHPI
ncbi:MAG: restriction endonuclease subunit S [Opitutae bacterium]|nr:restriction endonuclease subunit S [Opitutae bacterium]